MSIRLPTDRHLPNGRQPAKEGSFAEELANQSIVMAQQSPASMASQLSRRQPKSLAFSGAAPPAEKCQDARLMEGTGGKAVAPALGQRYQSQGFCHAHTLEMQPKAYPGDHSGSTPPLCSDLLSVLKQLT